MPSSAADQGAFGRPGFVATMPRAELPYQDYQFAGLEAAVREDATVVLRYGSVTATGGLNHANSRAAN